jgi:hypothetical protein
MKIEVKEEIKQEHNQKIEKMKNDLNTIRKDGKNMILELEKETKDRAKLMATKKENKIKQLANRLLDVQLNKIDSKLKYL